MAPISRPRHARHESGGAWLADSLDRLGLGEEARAEDGRGESRGATTSAPCAVEKGEESAETQQAKVLLAYFETLERFDAWVAVSNLWERREHAGVSDYLCARLYREASDESVERYLSQIVTMWMQRLEGGTIVDARGRESFERMMVMSSRRSLRLATKICWLLAAAAGDSGDPKAVLAFKETCEREAVSNGTWPAPFEERMTKASSRGELASSAESAATSTELNRRTGASTPTSTSPRAGISVGEPVTPPRRILDMAKSSPRSRSSQDEGKVGSASPGGFFSNISRALSFGSRSSPSASKRDKHRGDVGVNQHASKKGKEKSPMKTKESPQRSPSGLSALFNVCGARGLPGEDGAKALSLRKKTFEATMRLTDDLCDLSVYLSTLPHEKRQNILRQQLSQMNKRFRHMDKGTGILFPMGHGMMERVIRIPITEAVLLNSREKAPYLVCLEVVNSNPTQFEMHNARSSMELHGDAAVDDFYPIGDDFLVNSNENIRRSLDSPNWRAPRAPSDSKESFSTEDSADSPLSIRLSADEQRRQVTMNVVSRDGDIDVDPPHERKPSDVALIEMAAKVNRMSWDPQQDELDMPEASGVEASMTSSPHKRSAGGLGELWTEKRERIRRSSPYGDLQGWDLKPLIIKAGDNCRQELLALQLVRTFAEIYRTAGVRCWIRDFDILTTNTNAALIEAVTDAPSVHALKSRSPRGTTLRSHFERKFGVGTPEFRKAQNNFVESLAGYSIMTYILQVKDRHNGNILLRDDGHLIHIDFGFMLSTSPGGINFESSPFKLTKEYLEVMDTDVEGRRSDAFDAYKALCIQGYLAVREHAERIVLLVQMMGASGCPCFHAGPKVIKNLRRRFNLHLGEEQCVEAVLGMISDSIDAWSTRQYDFYQRILNGIL